jgi:hypothetical protein
MTRRWIVVPHTIVHHVKFTLRKDSAGSSLHRACEVQGEDFTVKVSWQELLCLLLVNCNSLYYLKLERAQMMLEEDKYSKLLQIQINWPERSSG